MKLISTAAKAISDSGIMRLREPPEDEKKQQNQKVSIAVAKKQRPIKEIIEEILNEFPQLTAKNRRRILASMLDYIGEEGAMTEVEIQERTRKMVLAFI